MALQQEQTVASSKTASWYITSVAMVYSRTATPEKLE